MFIKVYKIFKYFIVTIFALIVVFVGNSSFEIISVNKKFEDFKARGVEFHLEGWTSSDTTKNRITTVYRVPKQYEYEDLSREIVDFDKLLLGSKADIIMTNRNPMRNTPELNFPMNFLAHDFFLGHTSINADDGMLYEVLGNSGDPSHDGVRYRSNKWLNRPGYNSAHNDYPILIGLRIKDTTEGQRNQMMEYAEAQVGKGYNYSFVFNRDRTFYCTDLVSRAVANAGININYDHLATTGNDIIVSDNVYLTFYREATYIDGVKHESIYFLDEGETE